MAAGGGENGGGVGAGNGVGPPATGYAEAARRFLAELRRTNVTMTRMRARRNPRPPTTMPPTSSPTNRPSGS